MLAPLGVAGLPEPGPPPNVYWYPGIAGRPRRPGFRFRDAADEILATVTGPLDVAGLAAGAYAVADLLAAAPGLAFLHRLLPCSRLIRIPGPHMVTLECPEQVREAIASHLAWVRR